MGKRRRWQCIFSNLLRKCKVSSEGGEVRNIIWSPGGYLSRGGTDWIQISKDLGLIQVFYLLSPLREKENRTEILNLIKSLLLCFSVKVILKKELIFRHVTVSKLS